MTRPQPHSGPTRRLVLSAALSTLGAALGCGGAPPAPTRRPTSKPLITVRSLTDLVPLAGLRWLVEVAPTELLSNRSVQPALARVLRDERLDLLASATGIDLRQVPELVIAAFDPDETILQLTRHREDPLRLERLFRQRLTSDEQRSVDADHQLVRASGRIGTQQRVFVAIGVDVVGYQYGGSARQGPARIAELYAAGKLRRTPPVTQDPELGPLWTELGTAPLRAALLGPFEGDLAQGAHGLLRVATAVCGATQPKPDGSLELSVLLGGDYSADLEKATRLLQAAWQELSESDLGHLLGLNRPRSQPQASADPRRLRLVVPLDTQLVFDGLAAATTDNIREIMRRTPRGNGPELPSTSEP